MLMVPHVMLMSCCRHLDPTSVRTRNRIRHICLCDPGGATDFRELYDNSAQGLDEARRVLKKRGRWLSDIAFIYARASLDTSLEASARLADVTGRDVESAFSGWAEPAV